jgi:hypothetical protein
VARIDHRAAPLPGSEAAKTAPSRARHDHHDAVAGHNASAHAPAMFVVTEAEAAAIRAVYEQRGELSAAVELRRRIPGTADNAQARECARTIAGWKPLLSVKRMPKVPRLRPSGHPLRHLQAYAAGGFAYDSGLVQHGHRYDRIFQEPSAVLHHLRTTELADGLASGFVR